MRALPATLPVLFLCEMCFLLGHGLIMTLLGVRMSLEGFPSQMAGLLMSSFSLGFVAGSYWLEKRIRSVGHIRVFAACAASLAVTAMLHGLWVNPWAWLVWRLIGGGATAGLLMVMESWVSGESSNDNRGKVLGWYMVISTTSLAGGQWMLNIADPAGPVLFSVVGMLFALSLVPLSIHRIHGPSRHGDITPRKIKLKTLYRRAPVGLVGAFTGGLMVQAFFAMTPYYGQEIGLTTAQTAKFMAVTTLVALVAQWGLGRVSDRLDRRRVILWMAIVMTVTGALISVVAGGSFWWLLAIACGHTAMLHTLYSLSLAHTNDWLEPEEVVAANAKLMMWYGIGSVIGPFSASLVMQAAGPDGLWLFLGMAAFSLAMFVMVRLHGERDRHVEQEPFVAQPVMETPHFAEVDPRHEPQQLELDLEAESTPS
ncbi:MFS transporter [Halomonas denitrificans]|uniref:MFS transporter n=1 Tax=Halomonas TaxID=2745 RepID=UPI001A904534|nr:MULTISPECIES: MFS transporter [Halomonas]MBY6029804.1 MFS transporter [Halomonas sp. DP8Y7-1]MED5293983.1 MFS transporter [Pseudomonadota bacterium]MBN8411183.1 MFS transporter [Halomonas litopenaei]MBY5925805.1 MFS transporter [Halomonas sp. DP4Y7-2]MBY5927537.1 MFS transporter [Halomonas sp. DP8Y7-3]